jgi:hypothetical protein
VIYEFANRNSQTTNPLISVCLIAGEKKEEHASQRLRFLSKYLNGPELRHGAFWSSTTGGPAVSRWTLVLAICKEPSHWPGIPQALRRVIGTLT